MLQIRFSNSFLSHCIQEIVLLASILGLKVRSVAATRILTLGSDLFSSLIIWSVKIRAYSKNTLLSHFGIWIHRGNLSHIVLLHFGCCYSCSGNYDGFIWSYLLPSKLRFCYTVFHDLKVNGFIVYNTLNMVDLGGAITVHLFATIFGLSVSRMLFKPSKIQMSPNIDLAERTV